MHKIRVVFEIELPTDCDLTYEEIDDWLSFNLVGGKMKGDHPLMSVDVAPKSAFDIDWDWVS